MEGEKYAHIETKATKPEEKKGGIAGALQQNLNRFLRHSPAQSEAPVGPLTNTETSTPLQDTAQNNKESQSGK